MARRAHLGLHLTAVDPALLPIARAPRPPPPGFAPAEHLELLAATADREEAEEADDADGLMEMFYDFLEPK